MDTAPDGDVAGAFSQGHPDALALAYNRFGPLVYSIALRSLGTRPDAEDVTQQVFVAAWHRRDSFDPGRGTLGGWLVAITRNKVTDALRERPRDSRVLLQAARGPAVQAPMAPPGQVVDKIVLADELTPAAGAPAAGDAAGVLFRSDARADRPGSRAAARHGEEPHPPRPGPAAV